MPRKKAKVKLPKYVVVQEGQWYVRRSFATKKRDNKGRIIYMQPKRVCDPMTEHRAAAIAKEIEDDFRVVVASPSNESITVGQYLERYLKAKKGAVSRRTHDLKTELYERYIKDAPLAYKQLDKLKPLDVQTFYGELADDGTSGPMIRNLHEDLLSTAFRQAVNWETIPRNPASGVLLPKKVINEATWFGPSEVKAFMKACARSVRNVVFEFALETGMRPGEYLALRWDSLDLDNRLVKVVQAVAINLRGGGYEIKELKTRSSRRTIEITPEMAGRLREHRQYYDNEIRRLECAAATPPLLSHMKAKGTNFSKRKHKKQHAAEIVVEMKKNNLVFPASNGRPMSRLNLTRRRFKPLLEEIGLDASKYSLYTLRHTCATLSLAAGANIKAVAEKLGHADVNMLLTVYAHVLPSMRAEATEKLGNVLYPKGPVRKAA